jgi:hypothetical protein
MTRLHTGTGTLLLLVSLLSCPQAGKAFQTVGGSQRGSFSPSSSTANPAAKPTTTPNPPIGSAILRFRHGGWALPVIKSEEMDFEIDVGRGGVRLAQESAVKMVGQVKHKPGSATAQLQDLIRYTDVTLLDEKDVKDQLQTMGATIVCTGQGKELYKDPGETAEVVVVLAPLDAVRDALMGAGSAMTADKLVINVAGGDDLQVKEVIEALEELVLDLDVPTKAKIHFNSLSHSSFPKLAATVTAVAVALAVALPEEGKGKEEASSGGKKGAEKSVAEGEVYFSEGKWYTVVQEDINTAKA